MVRARAFLEAPSRWPRAAERPRLAQRKVELIASSLSSYWLRAIGVAARRFRPLSRCCTRSATCLLFALSHRWHACGRGVNGRATQAAERDGCGLEMIDHASADAAAAGGGRRAKSLLPRHSEAPVPLSGELSLPLFARRSAADEYCGRSGRRCVSSGAVHQL